MRLLPEAESERTMRRKDWSREDVSSKRSHGEEEEGGEGGHYGMTNTSIIAPPLPPHLPRASGLSEEVMTLCPDTAKSYNGILPASACNSMMRTMIMMATSAGIHSLSKQTHALIDSSFSHLRCSWV